MQYRIRIMKLELRHLAPYLLHRLKAKNCFNEIVEVKGIQFGNESCNNVLWTFVKNGDYLQGYLYQCKPILRPLSDLTKKIEHNGKRFVPIDWLFENVNEKLRFSDDRFMDYDDGKSKDILHYSIYDVFSDSITIDEILILTNKIFEWHFDVFSLIEKGLAIDINTL